MISDSELEKLTLLTRIPYAAFIDNIPSLPCYQRYQSQWQPSTALPNLLTLRFIARFVTSQPWLNHTVFYAMLLRALNVSHKSTYHYTATFNKVLMLACGVNGRVRGNPIDIPDWLFDPKTQPQFILDSTRVNEVITRLLHAPVSKYQRWERYRFFKALIQKGHDWWELYGDSFGEDSPFIQALLIPSCSDHQLERQFAALAKTEINKAKKKRKKTVDQVTPYFRELRMIAKSRRSRFEAFYQAVKTGITQLLDSGSSSLTFEKSIEGDRLELKIWRINRLIKHIKNHQSQLNQTSLNPETFDVNIIESSDLIAGHCVVEVLNADKLDKTKWWFIEWFEYHVFTDQWQSNTTVQAKRCAFFDGYNYPHKVYKLKQILPECPGLSKTQLMKVVSAGNLINDSVFLLPHFLRVVLQMGALFTELLVVTGARVGEIGQLAASPDLLKKLLLPMPGNANQFIEKYVFMSMIKGEDSLKPFFISAHTVKDIAKTISIIQDYYQTFKYDFSFGNLPLHPSNKHWLKREDEQAPFVFQFKRRTLNTAELNYCLRLILHGALLKYSADGRKIEQVKLTAHLLRHAFAQFAVHVKKLPVDVVAKLLNQKHIPVTDYYAEPTMHILAARHEALVNDLVETVNIKDDLARSPKEMIAQFEASQKEVGTLTEVLGGTCTAHGYCAAQFSCIGCGSKIPDPNKRDVVLRKARWAKREIPILNKQSLLPEVNKMKRLINACELEIQEMDAIERYEQQLQLSPLFDSEKSSLNNEN